MRVEFLEVFLIGLLALHLIMCFLYRWNLKRLHKEIDDLYLIVTATMVQKSEAVTKSYFDKIIELHCAIRSEPKNE